MKKIGLIGAMDSEIANYREDFCAVESPYKNILKGSFSGKEIYICRSGIGKVNAAIATQRLIDLCGVEAVINSGAAGGIAEKIQKYDVVISKSLTYHDFVPLDILERYSPYTKIINADEALCQLALKACHELNQKLAAEGQGFSTHFGTIVTGDCFVSSNEHAAQLRQEFDAICTEMEGMAVAHTCKVNDIPFVVIRAISDFADDDTDASSNGTFEAIAARRAAYIVKEMLK